MEAALGVIELILEILIILLSLVLIIAVALQKGKSDGITGVTASNESDNYFGKGKELGSDEKLAKITKICTIIFVVVSIILTVVLGMRSAAAPKETTTSAISFLGTLL